MLLIVIVQSAYSFTVSAAEVDTYDDITDNLIDSLDEDELNQLLTDLTDEQKELFGATDFISLIKQILSGDFSLNFSSLPDFIFSILGTSLTSIIALIATIIGIAIVFSIINAFNGGKNAENVTKVIHFAAMAVVLAVIGGATISLISACTESLNQMHAQISAITPIMLTLMAASGATSTSAVFSPMLAIMTNGLFGLIVAVLIPMIIAAFIFEIVGNISGEIKLGKTSEFFTGSVKWMFGTGFFLLTAFMSLQGITASVADGISIRTAKFTIGKFVPVIGSYLSEGFNLVISGSVLMKNALGYSAVILLAVTMIPVIIRIGIFSLALKLAAAIVEPLGDKLISDTLSGAGKIVSLMGAVMAGATFLYFIFILILVATGNVYL